VNQDERERGGISHYKCMLKGKKGNEGSEGKGNEGWAAGEGFYLCMPAYPAAAVRQRRLDSGTPCMYLGTLALAVTVTAVSCNCTIPCSERYVRCCNCCNCKVGPVLCRRRRRFFVDQSTKI
jgi:hypothetical protein